MLLKSCVIFVFLFSQVLSFSLISREEETETPALSFKLLHINDIHAHFEETNEDVGRCHERFPHF